MSDLFDAIAGEIQTSRLWLRPLTVDDAPAIYRYASDPEVARYTLWPPHESEVYTRGFLQYFTARTMLSWAMILTESSETMGMVFLHSLHKSHGKAEIAFNLARKHWGRGLATESAGAVVDHVFSALALNRLEATCMPANVASSRVLVKIGMTHEGRLRRSHARYDGYHDMDVYGILSGER